MIEINKAERAVLRALFPALQVRRTKSGKYLLCEESKYLTALPGNAAAVQLLRQREKAVRHAA